MSVRAAFISGGMYDNLYSTLDRFTQTTGISVESGLAGRVSFLADHPTLNAHLSGLAKNAGDGAVPYDIVSTHTKYAPSQSFLAPLDDLLAPEELNDFVPLILSLARIDGALCSLPRNIDVRLLHYRTDFIRQAPTTWDELFTLAFEANRPPEFFGFVFPGMESGLFGTFFELAEMGGAHVFPPDLIPDITNDGGYWALEFLRACYAEGVVPPEIVNWHYDKVHDFFRDGHAAMVGDWPGYYSDHMNPETSAVHARFALAPYPAGPTGKSLAYAGGHSFALTRRGAKNPQALELLRFLTAPEQQLAEARRGSVPVRASVMKQIQSEAQPAERARWEMLEQVLSDHLLIPPKFARYPLVEEVLWTTVQSAMTGTLGINEALRQMTFQIRAIVP